MAIRWLECGTGNLHIVGPCPRCGDRRGGLLLGTVAGTFRGRITAKCTDCNEAVDYYVDAHEGRIWSLVPVEAKGSRTE